MAKELLSRYVWLTDLIYRNKGVTFKEVNEKWRYSQLYDGKDIPLRTFHRQCDEIERLFDVNIVCDRTNGYRYRIENPEDIKRVNMQNWLLNTVSINHLLQESSRIKDRIIMDDVPSSRGCLAELMRAMTANVAVRVLYEPYWASRAINITLFPYFVKMYEKRWYVYGRRDDEEMVKVYALDRITSLELTKKRFRIPPDFTPEEHLRCSIGVIRDATKPCTIQIKAFGNHSKYLRALPLHHSQEELTEPHEDCVVFSYYLCPTADFYQKILEQREYVQIISPKSVCEEIKRIIETMNKYYKKPKKR
jgi:hypothetical protein